MLFDIYCIQGSHPPLPSKPKLYWIMKKYTREKTPLSKISPNIKIVRKTTYNLPLTF